MLNIEVIEMEEDVCNGVTTVAINGRFDFRAVPQFARVMEQLIAKGERKIVLDLSKLDYLSSYGFGALLHRSSTLKLTGGDIFFCNIPPKIKGMLDLFGATSHLEIFDTVEEAEDAFQEEILVLA